jgi:hypothetical protein
MSLRTFLLLVLIPGVVPASDLASSQPKVTRAVAKLNGVFSPRGYFNILVRLNRLPGADAAKLDLKKSRITMDFSPGVTVEPAQLEDVIRGAGYRPGPIQITSLTQDQASETAPGWIKLKHPKSKNPVARWFELNF